MELQFRRIDNSEPIITNIILYFQPAVTFLDIKWFCLYVMTSTSGC